jgi:hypothetical protein
MTRRIYLISAFALFVACAQKRTTVNPPAEKKESNTTIVKPPAEKKDSQTTVINSPATTETKKEKTELNIGTSPRPVEAKRITRNKCIEFDLITNLCASFCSSF